LADLSCWWVLSFNGDCTLSLTLTGYVGEDCSSGTPQYLYGPSGVLGYLAVTSYTNDPFSVTWNNTNVLGAPPPGFAMPTASAPDGWPSPGDTGCVYCAPPCTACCGVHLNKGTITDSNGTFAFKNNNGPIFQKAATGLWTDMITYPVDGCDNCKTRTAESPGTGAYWYNVSCIGDQIFINQHWATMAGQGTFLFLNPQCADGLVFNYHYDGQRVCDVSSTGGAFTPACGQKITGQGTLNWQGSGVAAFDPPPSSFSVELEYEQPKPQSCCGPCPVPNKDLTLSFPCPDCSCPISPVTLKWTGGGWSWTGTLYYGQGLPPPCSHLDNQTIQFLCASNPDGTLGYSFYVNQLALWGEACSWNCSWPTSALVNYSCSPFHAEFKWYPPQGGAQNPERCCWSSWAALFGYILPPPPDPAYIWLVIDEAQ
jgi:hypothetical protein